MKRLMAILLTLMCLVGLCFTMPVSAAGKEIRLEWTEEGSNGNWLKLPGGVKAEVGDIIIFPEVQYLVKTADGSRSGVPVNVTCKTDGTLWDAGNWGQPWGGGKGDGFKVTVVEGENIISCLEIFDPVEYAAVKTDPLVTLIKFNSGDVGAANQSSNSKPATSSTVGTSSKSTTTSSASSTTSAESTASVESTASGGNPTFDVEDTPVKPTDKSPSYVMVILVSFLTSLVTAVLVLVGYWLIFIKKKKTPENPATDNK